MRAQDHPAVVPKRRPRSIQRSAATRAFTDRSSSCSSAEAELRDPAVLRGPVDLEHAVVPVRHDLRLDAQRVAAARLARGDSGRRPPARPRSRREPRTRSGWRHERRGAPGRDQDQSDEHEHGEARAQAHGCPPGWIRASSARRHCSRHDGGTKVRLLPAGSGPREFGRWSPGCRQGCPATTLTPTSAPVTFATVRKFVML